MRAFRLAVVTALLAGALPAAAASAAALPTFASKQIVVGKSIGGVAIGQAGTDAANAWGGMASAAQCGRDDCIWTDNANKVQNGSTGRAIFYFGATGVTIATIEAPDKSFSTPLSKLKTAKGIHLGSKVKALKQAYKKKLKKVDGGSGYGIRYEIKKGKVTTQFFLRASKVSTITLTVY
jgi:hypothetical protein